MDRPSSRVNRRAFLRAAMVAGAGSALLSACQQAAAPAPKADPKSAEEPQPAEVKPAATQPAAAAKPTEAPKPTEVPKPAAQPTAAPTSAPAASKPVTIQYWHINTEVFGLPAIRDLIAAFQKDHPHITVEERNMGNYTNVLQGLQAASATRTPPAVAQIGFSNVGYVADNIPTVPLETLAAREPEVLRGISDRVLALGKHGGKLVGVPYSVSYLVNYVNASLLGQAGVEFESAVATWQDVRSAARLVKERTGKFGFSMISDAATFVGQTLIESNGGRMLSEDGTTAAFDRPEAAEAMQLLGDLVHVDKTMPILTQQEATQSFSAGDIAIGLTSSAHLNTIQRASKFDLRTAKVPAFGDKERRTPGGGNCLFVTASDPDQQAAGWEWLKFLVSREGMTTWLTATGYVPIHTDIEDDARYLKPYYEQNPLGRAALSQREHAVPWVAFPGKNGPQAEKVFTEARDAIIGGQSDARTALADAAAQVNALIRS